MTSFEHTLSLDMIRSSLLNSFCTCDILHKHDYNFADIDNVDVSDALTYRRAAVLVVIYGMSQKQKSSHSASLSKSMSNTTVPSPAVVRPIVIMTVKSIHMNIHAGEISFPGGKVESGDSDLLHTALRETHEEIGLSLKREQIIGRLCPVKTRNSGFVIVPFVSIISQKLPLTPNIEVEEILELPLGALLDTVEPDVDSEHDVTPDMYTFEHPNTKGKKIWGASARILKQIHTILNA